jgi:hypothetical protein
VFARLLHAVLVLAEQETEARRRLYVHAEPGVLALLLYGAIRLLPPTVTDDLTFSTFEPYHRNFRDYKLAEVVGTYLGGADRGLDPDLGTSRGVALDTFVPARSSPELRPPPAGSLPAGVNDLIDLVARNEWNLLPAVRAAVGPEPGGLARAGDVLARARNLARVDAGAATVEELLAIQHDRVGAEELRGRADRVWPRVKEAAPTRADVRAAFRDLLADPDRVRELWEEGVEAILKEDFRRWDARWAVLRDVPGPEEARKLLNKLVGAEKNEGKLAKVPTDVRARFRAACADVGLLPPRALLVPIGLGELEPLLAGPPEWAGYTAFVLLARDELNWLAHVPPSNRTQMRKRAKEFLSAAPAAALAAYVHAARPYLATDPTFLDALFKPYSATAARLMDALLAAGTLDPGDWMAVCASVGLTQDEWGEFLLEKDRLARLLVGLGGDGTGKDVWAGYLGLLTPALVSPDLIEADPDTDPQAVHEWERTVHAHLRTAAERLTTGGVKLAPALPKDGVGRLFAANNLLKWVEHPATAERDGSEEVRHACTTFAVDRLAVVRVAYRAGGFDRLELPAQLPHLEPLLALFRAAFPVDEQYHTARTAVSHWLDLSAACPRDGRGHFQAHFVLTSVPDVHYPNLLAERRDHPFESLAETTIRHRLASPRKAGSAKYVPPAPTGAEAAPAEAVEEPAGRGDGGGPVPTGRPKAKTARAPKQDSYAPPRRDSGTTKWLWLIVALAALTVLVVAAVVVTSGRRESTPAADPTPEKKDPPKATAPKAPIK